MKPNQFPNVRGRLLFFLSQLPLTNGEINKLELETLLLTVPQLKVIIKYITSGNRKLNPDLMGYVKE